MVDIEVGDELTVEERKAVINGKAAETKKQPVRWGLMWAIGIALLFLFFEVVDQFYASLP